MRKYLAFIIVCFCCNCSLQQTNHMFYNKYLIYSKVTVSDSEEFFANFFTANFNDTIFEISNSLFSQNLHEKQNYTLPSSSSIIACPNRILEISTTPKYVATQSSTPYQVIKNKKDIYFQYYSYNKVEKIKRYSFIKDDTIPHQFSFYKGQTNRHFLFSVYTGVDTNIKFQNRLVRCKKVVEELSYSSSGKIYYEKYIEPNSCVPLLINKLYYTYFDSNLVYTESYRLRFTLSKDEIDFIPFYHPDDFYAPVNYYDSLESIKFDTINQNGSKYIIKKQ